ncbi:MAG TPA: SRPBCC domain-containing protein [Thermoanaerobaculia bacterium]|nr:SRPBCC domain-containing protein [Thermoanaerobaculia bacterium]
MRFFAAAFLIFIPSITLGNERAIEGEVIVPVNVATAWNAWTTEEGITSFFAPAARIDARPDGAFEIWFDPSQPRGMRGADGMRFLAVDPMNMISFTWNAPPQFPNVRKQRTHVVVRFEKLSDSSTRVTLRHDGFGQGEEWDGVFAYFERAWKELVLPAFAKGVSGKD